jgi:hypothetical protein
MTEVLENVVIPIVAIVAAFGSLFGSVYLWITRRHLERLAMIEKGLEGALAPNPRAVLRAACTVIGLSLGLMAGWMLAGHAGAPWYVAGIAAPLGGLGLGMMVYLSRSGSADREAV